MFNVYSINPGKVLEFNPIKVSETNGTEKEGGGEIFFGKNFLICLWVDLGLKKFLELGFLNMA